MSRIVVVAFVFVTLVFLTSTALPSFAASVRGAWDFSEAKSLPYQTSTGVLFENVKIDGVPYAVIMESKRGNLLPIEITPLPTVTIPTVTGDPDWETISPVVVDNSGDERVEFRQMTGTDLDSVYMARDDTYLYFRMTFHDGPPIAGMFVVEFQQYSNQLHTPGDRYVHASSPTGDPSDWRVVVHDRTNAPGLNIAEYPDPLQENVKVGASSIDWKVPIADMKFPPNTPRPYYAPPGPAKPGIENTFIRAYIHPYPQNANYPSDDNGASTRPMIINFY